MEMKYWPAVNWLTKCASELLGYGNAVTGDRYNGEKISVLVEKTYILFREQDRIKLRSTEHDL